MAKRQQPLGMEQVVGVIKAVSEGRHTFTTVGELMTSDLQNTASYNGKSTGISIGTGYSGGNASLNGAGVGQARTKAIQLLGQRTEQALQILRCQ